MTIEVEAKPSVSGLRAECLPFGEVLAQSVANIAPTATPTIGLGLVYASSGNGTWLAFVIATVGLVFVSFNINQFASRSASPGSIYSYVAKGLGAMTGVVCGWALILAYVATAMAVLTGFGNYGGILFGLIGLKFSPIFLFAIGAGLVWYVAYRDIQISAVMMLVMEAVSVSLILILSAIVWFHKGLAIDTAQLTLHEVTPKGIAQGLVLAVFSFVGFESATSLGDEAKNPLRTIPNAVVLSTITGGLFFIVVTLVEVFGFSGSSTPLDKSDAPLSYLANLAGVGWLGVIISMGATLSFFACTLACINAGARIFFTMARHRLFHPSLGSAHQSNQTPYVAVTMTTLFAFLVTASLSMFGVKNLDIYGYMGTIGTFGFLLAYILISIAAPIYLNRMGQLRPLDVLFAIVAIAFMLVPVIGSVGIPGKDSIFPVPDPPGNVFPYLFLMFLVVGGVWFLMLRLHSPEIIEEMEQDIEAVHTKFSDMKKV